MFDILLALVIVFGVLALLLVVLILYIKTQYRHAGERLLVLPLSKSRRFIYLALGVMLLITGYWIMFLDSANNGSDDWYSIIGGAISGSSANFWLQVLLPTELRKNGIISFGSLVKWSRIESYEWKGGERLLLRFKPKHFNQQRKCIVKVLSARRERVEQILREKLSNRKNYTALR